MVCIVDDERAASRYVFTFDSSFMQALIQKNLITVFIIFIVILCSCIMTTKKVSIVKCLYYAIGLNIFLKNDDDSRC